MLQNWQLTLVAVIIYGTYTFANSSEEYMYIYCILRICVTRLTTHCLHQLL